MKNWWLKLYTIPSLKITARSTAIVFTVAMLMNHFAHDMLFLIGYGSCYIVYAQRESMKSNFGRNLEFHKLHIPFKELKKAVIADGLIRGGAILLGSLLCNFYAYINNGFVNIEAEGPLFTVGAILFQLFFISNMTTVNTVVNGKLKYVLVDQTKFNKLGFFIVSTCIWTALTILLFIPTYYGFNILFLVGFFILGFFIQYRKFIYQAAFHQAKSVVTYKKYFQSTGVDLLTGFGLYMVAALVSYPVINSTYVDVSIRESAFKMVGAFAPDLDVETAKEFIKENRYSQHSLENIFKHSPDIAQVPISEILDKPRMSEYVTYLENIENPSPENIMFMMNHPIQRTTRNVYLYPVLNKLIVDKWPKNQKFPEHLLDKQIQTERLPATISNVKKHESGGLTATITEPEPASED